MLKRTWKSFILILLISVQIAGQETGYGPGYQTIILNNPAFAGVEGDGILKMSYMNFYPGKNYNFHSVFLSYDSFIPLIHGGAGIYLADDYLGGFFNDTRGGFAYSYHLKAGINTFINAGLAASFYHRGFRPGNAVLPDQIDPLGGVSLPPGEILSARGHTAFDAGAGFLLTFGNISGGFSVSHLTQPLLSASDLAEDILKRKYQVHLAGLLYTNKNTSLNLWPVVMFEQQGQFSAGSAGIVADINFVSFNLVALAGTGRKLDIQTGFSLKTGKMFIFYNYRFNLVSENSLLPFSLLHQTGLSFSLNYVDKRKNIKTINLPEL